MEPSGKSLLLHGGCDLPLLRLRCILGVEVIGHVRHDGDGPVENEREQEAREDATAVALALYGLGA